MWLQLTSSSFKLSKDLCLPQPIPDFSPVQSWYITINYLLTIEPENSIKDFYFFKTFL